MAVVRRPVAAGRFYPADQGECDRMLDDMLRGALADPVGIGAIVPHAGWIYSGPAAAQAWSAVAQSNPQTVIIFGAVHQPDRNIASIYPGEAWETPLGHVETDVELLQALSADPLIATSADAHRYEHSIEVQLPIMQRLLPTARLCAISVRPSHQAAEVGRHCAQIVSQLGRSAVFVGSTDLTHYGPAFGYMPEGVDERGLRWAKDVNDRRLIKLIEKLDADAVVGEATLSRNACGPGAVAATIAASVAAGASRYVELIHVTSAEVAGSVADGTSVGYEAGVFVRNAS